MQQKETFGEQVRKIADQLRQETNLQIKATSRILGAAAQISENHDRLIDEVVNMVEEDLDKQVHTSQQEIYTVAMLKKRFSTFKEAKSNLGLKASSWSDLAEKINDSSGQNSMITDSLNDLILKRLDSIEREVGAIRIEMSQILSLLTSRMG